MYSSKRRYSPTKGFIHGSSARYFCIETILVYKLPRLTREEIIEMIGLQVIELKQTRFYQDVFKEGLEEGRQEGELTIILRLLGRRFSNLPESLVGRLHQMDAGQLEAFSEVLLDASSLDDINDWLQKRQ
jgi:predicted transposase YdaD